MKESKEILEAKKMLRKMAQLQARIRAEKDILTKPRLLSSTLAYEKECFLKLFKTKIDPLPEEGLLEFQAGEMLKAFLKSPS